MNITENAEQFDSDSDKNNFSEPLPDSVPGNDSSMEALINQERILARRKLREELGREPTEEEADEWLSAHTESY